MSSALYMYVADNGGRLPKSLYSGNSDQDVRVHLAPFLFPEAVENSEKMRKTYRLTCPVKDWGCGFNSFVSETYLYRYEHQAELIYGMDLCSKGRWIDENVLTWKVGDLREAIPKPHSNKVGVMWLDGHVTFELVSTLTWAQVTKGSSSYKSSDEKTPIADKKFDR